MEAPAPILPILPETWPGRDLNWLPELMLPLPPTQRREIIREICERRFETFSRHWEFLGRPDQLPPTQARNGDAWTQWLVMGGRGAGKTRTGAEWVRGCALGLDGFAKTPMRRIAIVGETMADARDVMIEGVSGILSIHAPRDRPSWTSSRGRLEWRNGVVAHCFSAEDPESLRGPQFEGAWLDEFGKWRHGQECFDMLQFGLRLGFHPRQIITTTPRPVPLLKRMLVEGRSAVTRAKTLANAPFLSPDFLRAIAGRFGDTRLGRQELDGEIVEERADALWTRALLDCARVEAAPPLRRVVVAVDPPAASHKRADACGIVAAGIDADGVLYVLADETISAARPHAWAQKAVALYHRVEADALVAEVNQGGDMVAAVIAEADSSVPVRRVRATRGKYLRAEPVAQLYEQGRARHAGFFPALEDEMCDFAAGGLSNGRSPDRLDALVWAATELALTKQAGEPKVRRV